MDDLLLILAAFLSSTLTAIVGMGGGVLLISVMGTFLAPGAVVPVHGVVQLAANVSRAGFAYRHIRWSILGPYAAGVVAGAWLGSRFVPRLNVDYIPLLLGLFILFVTWLPLGGVRSCVSASGGPDAKTQDLTPIKYLPLGLVQSFLALFVGATGPLSSPFLLRDGLKRDEVVATHGVMVSVLHLVKSLVFFLLGFAFLAYVNLIAGMIVSVIIGSWVGTRLRSRVPEHRFRQLFRGVVTLLALRLIWQFFS